MTLGATCAAASASSGGGHTRTQPSAADDGVLEPVAFQLREGAALAELLPLLVRVPVALPVGGAVTATAAAPVVVGAPLLALALALAPRHTHAQPRKASSVMLEGDAEGDGVMEPVSLAVAVVVLVTQSAGLKAYGLGVTSSMHAP